MVRVRCSPFGTIVPDSLDAKVEPTQTAEVA
jgi:hypothetical protein